MKALVVGLDSVGLADARLVGGKAAVLGALKAAGFPVPSGLCITADAFELALVPYRDSIREILSGLDTHSLEGAQAAENNISALLRDLALPDEAVSQIERGLSSLGGERFAVRSSATAEDLTGASFAGQYETLLGVTAGKPLYEAVVTCWRSFFRANAIMARAVAGVGGSGESMPVLVQPVVDAECAGICFSVDPVRVQPDMILVDAAWGLGLGAVEGSVATDTYRLRRGDLSVQESHIVDKTDMYDLAQETGLQRLAVPDDRRKIACLPEEWLQRVAAFAVSAERTLGAPQDVEWAIAGGRVWILQSRPITTLPTDLPAEPSFPVAWNSEEEARACWILSIQSRQRVPLPLEHDYFSNYRRGWEEGEHAIGIDDPSRHKVVNGRRYWANAHSDLTDADRQVRIRAITEFNNRLIQTGGTTAWDIWGPEIISANERLRAFAAEQAGGPEMANYLAEAFAVARRSWMVHNLLGPPPIDGYMAAYTAMTGESGPEKAEEAAALVEGEETILTRLIDALYRLGEQARQIPALRKIILARPPDAQERIEAISEADAFRAEFQRLLEIYGDRTGVGFGSDTSIRTPTWREQPELVLALVATYLNPSVEDPATARARVREKRDAEVDALCNACANPALAAEFRKQLAFARKDATVLEEHNHYIDQLATGQARHAILETGRWLVRQGALTEPEEVFWLHLNEVLAVLRAEPGASTPEIIARRREEYLRWEKMEAPIYLGVPDAALPTRPPATVETAESATGGSGRLMGQGASPGTRSGRARVVSMGTLVPDVAPGDILVAQNAGPLWTPIFPILNGLVLDQGVVLGHAAVTAREYGIPAVVGTRNATESIPDGAWVSIDGVAGVVVIEREPD